MVSAALPSWRVTEGAIAGSFFSTEWPYCSKKLQRQDFDIFGHISCHKKIIHIQKSALNTHIGLFLQRLVASDVRTELMLGCFEVQRIQKDQCLGCVTRHEFFLFFSSAGMMKYLLHQMSIRIDVRTVVGPILSHILSHKYSLIFKNSPKTLVFLWWLVTPDVKTFVSSILSHILSHK